jgi:uroporphyrinogen-III decarboxylase
LGGISGIFDRLQNLRGYENLMFDLAEEREEVLGLLDRLTAYVLEGIDLSLEAKLDSIEFYDDWGTQESLIINPLLWRKIFKPRYKKLFDRVHQGGAYVYFHSCGQIMDIIPDLIEIGADIINPQISCMNLQKLTQITRGKICLASDIDQQYVLPFGTPAEVRAHTRKILDTFKAKDGGFIVVVRTKTDTSLANAEAMLREIWEY